MKPSDLPHLAVSCEGHWRAASLKHSKNQISIIFYIYMDFLTQGKERETIWCLQVYSGTSSLHLNIQELSNPNFSLNK